MYSVLIVDDEMAIRDNLPKAINFEKYGFCVCAAAKNGREALAFIEKYKQDLVMADICMPVLDGLGLIQRMKEEGYGDIPVIILSGHSNFQYAQKAITYGVKGYLTKPIDEDEAEVLLQQMAETLSKRKKGEWLSLLNTKKRAISNALVTGKKVSDLSGDALLYCVALSFHASEENITPYDVLQLAMQQVCPGHDFFCQVTGFLYTFYLPKTYTDRMHGGCKNMVQQLSDELRANGLECMLVYDTQILEEDGPLSEIFAVHTSRALSSVFWGKRGCLDYAKIEKVQPEWAEGCEDKYLEEIAKHISKNQVEEVLTVFNNFCSKLERVRPDMGSIMAINYKLFYLLNSQLSHTEQEDAGFMKPVDWTNSTYFYPFGKWVVMYKKFLSDTCTFLQESKQMSNLGLYGEIMGYVRRHFREPITIKEVADIYFVNAAYLGRMFQKATGVGFKQYVNTLRMNEAKWLLTSTDKKIYEIAAMTGFSESKYFITKFAQEEGISPTEYRKNQV